MGIREKRLKTIRGVMNLLTKDECEKTLDCLSDDDKMDELAQKFSMDDDYTSHINYEIARKWCYDKLKQCIDEHFSNPPLEFEELKPNMWVWDDIDKEYRKVYGKGIYLGDEYLMKTGCKVVFISEDECFYLIYEPNRFYRKEVQE